MKTTLSLRFERGFFSLFLMTLFVGPVIGQSAATWNDVTAEAGINLFQKPDIDVPYGGGTVWVDLDNDGWEDLLLSQYRGCSHFYRNLGDGSFERTDVPGLERECPLLTRGASAADYDNDGDQDVYFSANGQNRLMRNELIETGVLSLVDVTDEAGMLGDREGNSASAVWGDFDADGNLDLFVTNHSKSVQFTICEANLLYHNKGDGSFREVGRRMGVDAGKRGDGCGLAATWSDYDDDGDQDLMVVNDFGYTWSSNRLFRNDGPSGERPWLLRDVSDVSGFDYRMFGMGIAPGDYDRDGDLDYYSADIGANNLANNQGNGTFLEKAREAGVESNEEEIWLGSGLVSWGGVFADFNRDGWLDLVVSNGGAPAEIYPGMFGSDYINYNPLHIYGNLGNGSFIESHEQLGFEAYDFHRSVAVADYDQDGDLDLHFGVLVGTSHLYRNDGDPAGAHWLQVRAIGTVGNRDAIGARLELEAGGITQITEIDGGSSFLANSSRKAFFGLDQVDSVDRLGVRFLSGAALELFDLAVDQIVEVEEPVLDLRHSDRRGTFELRNFLDRESLAEIVEERVGSPTQIYSVHVPAGQTVERNQVLQPRLGESTTVSVRIDGRLVDQLRID